MAVSAVKKDAANPAAAADAPAPAPKKRRFNWKLAVVVLVVAGGLGGGAYWYTSRPAETVKKPVQATPAKPPQFLPLEAFTVNLINEENPQFLQVGLTLKVADTLAVDALKLRMPELRDAVLLLLSSQKASNLLTLEGKRKLAADIVAAINAILVPPAPKPEAGAAGAPAAAGAEPAEPPAADAAESAAESAAPPAVLGVLFTSFIIQ